MAPTAHLQHASIAPKAFRNAMAEFPTGVVVVTARHADGAPAGSTVSAVTSLSLEPALLLVCLKRGSTTLDAIRAGTRFAINVLTAEQQAVANAFGRRQIDGAWDLVDISHGALGVPLIDRAQVHVECSVDRISDGGDHEIVIGRVVAFSHGPDGGEPLVHHRGAYAALANASPAAEAQTATPLLGCPA